MKLIARLAGLIVLAGFLLPSATIATAQTSRAAIDQSISVNLGDPLKFQQMMTALQQAVAKHDAAAVAALVSYPITVNPRTKTAITIRTPKTFITSYDKVITPHIADVIEKQKYEDLFVNDQGAMFGTGEVWIAGICRDKACRQSDLKIRTIQNTSGTTK